MTLQVSFVSCGACSTMLVLCIDCMWRHARRSSSWTRPLAEQSEGNPAADTAACACYQHDDIFHAGQSPIDRCLQARLVSVHLGCGISPWRREREASDPSAGARQPSRSFRSGHRHSEGEEDSLVARILLTTREPQAGHRISRQAADTRRSQALYLPTLLSHLRCYKRRGRASRRAGSRCQAATCMEQSQLRAR
ncbi:hypothetical protein SAMN05216228_10349 [Rhizobium tibeticum]|uniref:Uncharacterized protein n=1 Tax=Rhizobium tibeticum TaxID=501024 RepID=A0A1H8UGB6_9HYPH|nr:hypothetical protein RTCCBAU85039_5634 [Rhizobium tibeticum]SEP02235.1 hypothetical protein SAMN05216228_10349 [Rhizobium tibeticum]